MTWVDFLREFGFPTVVLFAVFKLLVLPLKDRFVRHLDAIEEFFKVAPRMLGKLEQDAHLGAQSLREIVRGQADAAQRLTSLAEINDGRLAHVTHEVLGHLADAMQETLKVCEKCEGLDPKDFSGVMHALQEMKRKAIQEKKN